MTDIMLSEEKRAVIENIRRALADGDTFRCVTVGDPVPTDEDVRRVILPFDNTRGGVFARFRAFTARLIAESLTSKFNVDTAITGIENALSVTGGAIITSNHYNPTDSTPIRMLSYLSGKRQNLHIVVQESNMFMTGLFGYLMRNCNTHPVSKNPHYMVKNLKPALGNILKNEGFVLIYPEQEMWFNYKKPRPVRDGAYHYAALFGVPVIPTFTEMVTLDGERDADGLLPVKHILHILPPIYPDESLSVSENRAAMAERDYAAKRELYERIYGIPLTYDFIPERDIAGLVAKK
ncbi:MAG: 1-acyl-sn-glycerol-3-phosphate acyltransferase [Clostridia bacterium]|nr:1-acyl-sn-glycerol-3-phosphate acyltransferase [Clostridia bacterium]